MATDYIYIFFFCSRLSKGETHAKQHSEEDEAGGGTDGCEAQRRSDPPAQHHKTNCTDTARGSARPGNREHPKGTSKLGLRMHSDGPSQKLDLGTQGPNARSRDSVPPQPPPMLVLIEGA